MYYHASQTADIKVLEPRVSNHNRPLIYMSTKRENVLVYLSNAIEKCCRENGFAHEGKWHKWGPYSFTKEGLLCLEEYYPNALEDTYKGVSAYIYYSEKMPSVVEDIQISNAVATTEPVPVDGYELVEDAYAEILKAAEAGLIKLVRYEEQTEKKLNWIQNIMKSEYDGAANEPEYRFFIEKKFPFVKQS